MESAENTESFSIEIHNLRYDWLKNRVFDQNAYQPLNISLKYRSIIEFTTNSITKAAFIYRASSNLITAFESKISIWDLENHSLIKAIPDFTGNLNTINISFPDLVYASSTNEIIIFDLEALAEKKLLKGHTSEIKKVIYDNQKVFSLSKTFLYWDLKSDAVLEVKSGIFTDFCVCNNHVNVVLCTGGKILIWDLINDSEIFQTNGFLVDKVISNEDFLIFGHYEIPMNNWKRVTKKIATLDVVNLHKKTIEIRIPYKLHTKFLLHNNSLVFRNTEERISQWKLREISEVIDDIQMTSMTFHSDFLIFGTEIGSLYKLNLIDNSKVVKESLHDAEIIQIETRENLIFSAGFWENVAILDINTLDVLKNISLISLKKFCIKENELILISDEGQIEHVQISTGLSLYNENLQFNNIRGAELYKGKLVFLFKNRGLSAEDIEFPQELSVYGLACLTSQNNKFAVGFWSGKIIYWDMEDMKFTRIESNTEEIKHLSFDPTGRYLLYQVSSIYRIYSLEYKHNVFSFEATHAGFINSPKYLKVAYSTFDYKLKFLEIDYNDMKTISNKWAAFVNFKRKIKLS